MNKVDMVRSVFDGNASHGAPVTAYYHFGQQYLSGDVHAKLELEFYNCFKPDILKVMNDYSFPYPDGVSDFRHPEDIRQYAHSKGHLHPYPEQLKALSMIDEEIGDEVIVWDTAFNPWFTIRRNLLCMKLHDYMEEHKALLHDLLDIVTTSITNHLIDSLKHGAKGILYSVPASEEFITREHFREFAMPYDLKVINEVMKHTDMFVLHLHGGGETYYEEVFEHYPFHGLSWADRTTNLSLQDARKRTDKVLMGGINHKDNFNYRPFDDLEAEMQEALEAMKGTPFILSPGCVLQPQCPPERLKFLFDKGRELQIAH